MKPAVGAAACLAVAVVEIAAMALAMAVLLLLLITGIEPVATAAADPVVSTDPAPAAAPVAAAPVAAAPVAPAAPVAAAPVVAPVSGLTVAQLRQQARAAGLPRSLYRSGNRAELLNALGLA
jgi:hypothetical protein